MHTVTWINYSTEPFFGFVDCGSYSCGVARYGQNMVIPSKWQRLWDRHQGIWMSSPCHLPIEGDECDSTRVLPLGSWIGGKWTLNSVEPLKVFWCFLWSAHSIHFSWASQGGKLQVQMCRFEHGPFLFFGVHHGSPVEHDDFPLLWTRWPVVCTPNSDARAMNPTTATPPILQTAASTVSPESQGPKGPRAQGIPQLCSDVLDAAACQTCHEISAGRASHL